MPTVSPQEVGIERFKKHGFSDELPLLAVMDSPSDLLVGMRLV